MKTTERRVMGTTIGMSPTMNAVAASWNRDRLANKAILAHNARLLKEKKRREKALAAKTA